MRLLSAANRLNPPTGFDYDLNNYKMVSFFFFPGAFLHTENLSQHFTTLRDARSHIKADMAGQEWSPVVAPAIILF